MIEHVSVIGLDPVRAPLSHDGIGRTHLPRQQHPTPRVRRYHVYVLTTLK